MLGRDRCGSIVLRLGMALAVGACGGFDDTEPPPQPTDVSWSKSFGDDLRQAASAVVADAFGNVYVTGSFEGAADFGGGMLTAAGATDVFVAKYDTNGQHLWSRRFGDGAAQRSTAIALDAMGNLVVVGSFGGAIEFAGEFLSAGDGSDGFLLKLDADGEQLFGRLLPGAMQQRPTAVAVDAGSGDMIVAGDFDGELAVDDEILVSAGGRDLFVLRLTSSGELVWSQRFGDAATDDYATAIDVAISGNVAITGYTAGEIDFGGGPLLPIGIDPNDDAVLAVLDPGGAHVWSKRLGDAQYQRGHDVRFLPSGELLATGSFAGNINFGGVERTSTGGFDAYVAKLSEIGEPLWSRSFGVSDEQQGYRVAADRDGGVLLAGDFRGEVAFGGEQLSSAGDYDVYLAKLDASGNHVASLRFGDDLAQHLADLTVDGAGNAILVGSYFGSIDFGFGAHQSAGEEDPFVAKLSMTP